MYFLTLKQLSIQSPLGFILGLLFTVIPFQQNAKPVKGDYLILNNPADGGMFALFSSVLGALYYYDSGDYAGLYINLNQGIYVDQDCGPNWWEYFFEPIQLGDPSKQEYIFTIDDVLYDLVLGSFSLTREQAFALIQKYVHVKPDIQEQVDSYIASQFKDHFVIGVHHRGTDKRLEVPLVSYEKTLLALHMFMENQLQTVKDNILIYVATDDANFLEFISYFYGPQLIYNNFARSSDETPLHYGSGHYSCNYQKGKKL